LTQATWPTAHKQTEQSNACIQLQLILVTHNFDLFLSVAAVVSLLLLTFSDKLYTAGLRVFNLLAPAN